MTLIKNLALVNESKLITASEVSRVSAALQKQATRDLAPIWDISATVDHFPTLEDVPLGYWPILVMDDIDQPGASGVHMDKDQQPFALVQQSTQWSLTASHEMLEMLVDPFGNRTIAAQSIKPGQGRVEYLVEVSDPSEDEQFGYSINGILVSDFYTPHYFDPLVAPGVRYSFTGAITKPLEVLEGGYISWHDPVSDHWFQATHFGAALEFRDLGIFTATIKSLREEMDKRTFRRVAEREKNPKASALLKAAAHSAGALTASGGKAASLRAQIKQLVADATSGL
jgi:hypothetical protein